MRNLKRALSLALAAVMVLGLMMVGASAASFPDSDKIEHTDAVNNMVALGIIKGKDNGTFDPEGNVTRGEMAKMICVAMNGGKDPQLTGSTAYADTANHWAAGYIQWCTNQGIVAGYAGMFRPDDTVTGIEAAKMLLVALGYNSQQEKFENDAAWATNISVAANLKGLFEDVLVSLESPLNRDNAAQMIWNAVNATMVKYEFQGYVVDGNSITVAVDRYYNNSSRAVTILNDKFKAQTWVGTFDGNDKTDSTLTEGYIKVTGKLDTSSGSDKAATFPADFDIKYIGEEVKVIFKDGTSGTAGQPDKNDTIFGVYTTGATTVYNVTKADLQESKKTSEGKIKFGGTHYELALDGNNEFKVIVNYGVASETKTTVKDAAALIDGTTIATTGNLRYQSGDTIKFVANDDGKIYRAYVVESDIAKVTAKNSEKITLSGVGSIKIADNDVYEGVKKDDIVVVTKLYDSTLSDAYVVVEKAEVVSGTVKGFKDNDNVNLDGTTYKVNEKALVTNNFGSDAVADFSNAIGEDFDLYLVNGMVAVAIQTSESNSNYSLVIGVSDKDDVPGSNLNGLKIEVLGADGKKSILNVSDDSVKADGDAIANGGDIKVKDIVTYSINKDGDADVTIEASAVSTTAKYVKKTKTFDAITTATDCVLFASTSANGSYKAYKIRDLNDLEGTNMDMTVVMNSAGDRVLAVYMELGEKPSGATSTTVYGIVSDYSGTEKVDGTIYKKYTVMSNEESYTVYTNKADSDSAMKKGALVKFDPTSDDIYGTNDITILKGDQSNEAYGYVCEYNEADGIITVADTLNQDSEGNYDVASNATKTVCVIDDDTEVYFVDQDNDKGVLGSIDKFDTIAGTKNVLVIYTTGSDTVNTADVIIFEISNEADLINA